MVAASLSTQLRREQTAIAEQTTLEMYSVFGVLNFKNLDASSAGFIEASVSVAQKAHARAGELGGDMYLAMRRDAGVAGQFTAYRPQFDADELRAALVVLGPVGAKKLMSSGHRIPDAAQRVFTATSGRVATAALAGTRDAITGSTMQDSRAIAYGRQTRAGACDFCLIMSENTYKDAFSAMYSAGNRGRAKAPQPMGATFHDHCGCTVVTLFDGQLPERAKERTEFFRAWNTATRQGVDPNEFIRRTGMGADYLEAFKK